MPTNPTNTPWSLQDRNWWRHARMNPYFKNAHWMPVGVDPETHELTIRYVYRQFERRIRDAVWQYDTGIKVNIFGIPYDSITQVEWCKKNGNETMVSPATQMMTEDAEPEGYAQVVIPDQLLETPGELAGYIVNVNQETGTHLTIGIMVITVNARAPLPTPEPEPEPTPDPEPDNG